MWIILILIILISYLLADFLYRSFFTDSIKSNIDSHTYKVAKLPNRHNAAKYMGIINNNIVILLSYLHNNMYNYTDEQQRIIISMIKNYNPEVLIENDPRFTLGTSYTTNKGESMHLCLRSKNKPYELLDINDLIFVTLHELSHIGTYDSFGHTYKFWQVFKFVLIESIKCGIYEPVNYKDNPINYCGLHVAYNPLFDAGLNQI